MQERIVKIPMWQGSIDDLKRVVALCSDLHDEAVKNQQDELDEIREKAVADHHEDMVATQKVLASVVQFEDDVKEEQFNQGLSAALMRPELRPKGFSEQLFMQKIRELEVRVYSERFDGGSIKASPDDIFKTLNYKETKNLEIAFGSYSSDTRLSVDFRRERGVTVTVSGSDVTWVNGAIERLSSLLKQQQPPYSFMRSLWFSYPVFFFLAILLTVAAGNLFGFEAFKGFTFWGGHWLLGLIFVDIWTKIVLPRFELFGSGGRSRAKFLLASGVALVGFISAIVGLFK
ncbi:hypothetical protein MOD31_10975 [Paenarthrobacter sp. TYUT067]|uniref:hypothetical protein n=1 Tax=Paenarthrobacter sp. TYUT067 TaxID=2926245 RepID=UPI00202E1082|nr:hypothetical protein [Paenarthrobacter sp. TYUT067]MCM0616547.1 hypothetical protein [Paenarthrobacter sp. TYUT067]